MAKDGGNKDKKLEQERWMEGGKMIQRREGEKMKERMCRRRNVGQMEGKQGEKIKEQK